MTPRFLAVLGVGLGLAAGGATAVAVGMPGLAGAAAPVASSPTDDSTTIAPSTTDGSSTTDGGSGSTGATTAPGDTDPVDDATPHRGQVLEDVLQPLIEDGTLTQEQADKVIAALEEARPFGGHGGPMGGPGGFGGPGHGRLLAGLDTAATALGLSPDDLRDALADGKSIADVAAEQGVDVQTVIDALVAQASSALDEAVADGKLTADEATERAADLTERITELVEREGGLRPGRWGDHDRPGAPPVPEAPDAPEASTPDTTTGS